MGSCHQSRRRIVSEPDCANPQASDSVLLSFLQILVVDVIPLYRPTDNYMYRCYVLSLLSRFLVPFVMFLCVAESSHGVGMQ